MYDSSAESSCGSFLRYFHAAVSNHLSEKPKLWLVLYGRLTQVGLYLEDYCQTLEIAYLENSIWVVNSPLLVED